MCDRAYLECYTFVITAYSSDGSDLNSSLPTTEPVLDRGIGGGQILGGGGE